MNNEIWLKQIEMKIEKKREHLRWLSCDVNSSAFSRKLWAMREEEIAELEQERVAVLEKQ
jgi:hypothetical protein